MQKESDLVITVENRPTDSPIAHGIRDDGPYSTRNTSKGALIEEAGRVFAAIADGRSVEDTHNDVLNGTLLSQRSALNRKQIWTSIHLRYIVEGADWLTSLIARECAAGPHGRSFVTLLYLLYALRDRLTFDFVTQVLWPKG